ncbi:MAG: ribokinase [Alphaproteobacteria bacterium]|jgi:ribokinase|nr:ribokinase [Alphaproteobacteria bacterium]MBT5389415.1 ribokinase [Alphaproteobacteria bacterium]MBT5655109.1 ribokinase [Alphaproteobacteria bacterium]
MIIVFGSLNVDMIMPVATLPRPGETVLGKEYHLIPGGKGANQAVAAARSGAQVHMFGAVGKDGFAKLLFDSLGSANVNTDGIATSSKRTGCASISVDQNAENLITVASGANLDAKASSVPNDLLTANTILLFQMEVPAEENWKLIQRAFGCGCRNILNLAPAQAVPPEILKCLDILVVNEIETQMLAKSLNLTPTNQGVAKSISDSYGITCIVTKGAEGTTAYDNGNVIQVDAMKVNPVDTTGAGDTFVGALAAALDEGKTLADAINWANVAGALTCQKIGVQNAIPMRKDIESQM